MSATLLFKAFRAQLPPDQKLTLLILSDCADIDGVAWPTIAKLASMTGYSETETQAALLALQASNVIAINRNGKQPPGSPNRYQIDVVALDRLGNRRAQA